jgi:hypothetical protein
VIVNAPSDSSTCNRQVTSHTARRRSKQEVEPCCLRLMTYAARRTGHRVLSRALFDEYTTFGANLVCVTLWLTGQSDGPCEFKGYNPIHC